MYEAKVSYNDNDFNIYIFEDEPDTDYPFNLKINHVWLGNHTDMASAIERANEIILNDGVYTNLIGERVSVIGVGV